MFAGLTFEKLFLPSQMSFLRSDFARQPGVIGRACALEAESGILIQTLLTNRVTPSKSLDLLGTSSLSYKKGTIVPNLRVLCVE